LTEPLSIWKAFFGKPKPKPEPKIEPKIEPKAEIKPKINNINDFLLHVKHESLIILSEILDLSDIKETNIKLQEYSRNYGSSRGNGLINATFIVNDNHKFNFTIGEFYYINSGDYNFTVNSRHHEIEKTFNIRLAIALEQERFFDTKHSLCDFEVLGEIKSNIVALVESVIPNSEINLVVSDIVYNNSELKSIQKYTITVSMEQKTASITYENKTYDRCFVSNYTVFLSGIEDAYPKYFTDSSLEYVLTKVIKPYFS
tara:strand:+ start:3815 stop:4585 length:771 start_codon:yes stop_codon:yes gene_type:complete